MSAIDTTGWCTVEYDGDVGAKGGVPVFRTKGLTFAPGVQVRLAPEAARMVINAAPPGAMKVVDGKPAEKVTMPSEQQRVNKRRVEQRAGLSVLFRGAHELPPRKSTPAAAIVGR